MQKTAAALIVSILAFANTAAQLPRPDQPLLQLQAKSVSWGLTMPIPPVANAVISSLSRPQQMEVEGCLRSQHLQPRNYRALMLSWTNTVGPGRKLHIVRASERYCATFYGARDFAYYLVEERRGGGGPPSFRVIFANRGDRVAVLRSMSNGLNDIEAAGCNDRGCRIARLAFDGKTYRPVQCEQSEIRGKTEARRPRACHSDPFPDYQAPVEPPRTRR